VYTPMRVLCKTDWCLVYLIQAENASNLETPRGIEASEVSEDPYFVPMTPLVSVGNTQHTG
jgi:hypothetical protein